MTAGRQAVRAPALKARIAMVVALCAPVLLASADPVPLPLLQPQPARRLRTLSYNPEGYQESQAVATSDVLLGDLLFHSPFILGHKAQALGLSCQSCHPNGAAHTKLLLPGLSDRPGNVDLTTGFFRAGADDRRDNPLNIPSLRGVRYLAPYGSDGRTASLSEFIQGVVVDSFGGEPLSPSRLRALRRYVEEQDFLPNHKLDSHNQLSAYASAAERRGELLFRTPRPGLQACATCHPPSSMFRDGQVHRIGSGQPSSPYSFDDAYKTPTLLGTKETAPYFHDGRFPTLAAVVDFFNTSFHLGLNAAACADLTAYLEAVGAIDLRGDQRSIGQRLDETSAYLALLTDGEAREDRAIWAAALTALAEALTQAKEPPGLRPRIDAATVALRTLRDRSQSRETDLARLRPEVKILRTELQRLGADWTGTLAR
jgi:cytochrome c peroxidase